MDNLIYIIFVLITVPMLFMPAFLDKKSRITFSFTIIGILICLLAAEINTKILDLCGGDYFYLSTTLSPIVEEVLKGLPVLFAVLVLSDKVELDTTASWSFATGIGFALFENIISFFRNYSEASLLWAFSRGIGSGLMHSICTVTVGLGVYFIKSRRKMYFCDTFGLLCLAVLFHGTYNVMVETESLKHFGILLPVVAYILLFIFKKLGIKSNK